MAKEKSDNEGIVKDQDRTSEFCEKFLAQGQAVESHNCDIARGVAKSMGIGSAALELVLGSLAAKLKEAPMDKCAVGKLIDAAAGMSFACGRFAEGWLDAFNSSFINGLNTTMPMPLPDELEIPENTKIVFGEMLRIAVGAAEDKGKVGKVGLKKCVAFQPVKWWSECEGWRGGFSFDDRRRLLAVYSGVMKLVPSGDAPSVSGDAAAEIGKLRERLAEERKKSQELSAANNKLENQLRQREKRNQELEAELKNAQDGRSNDNQWIVSLQGDKARLTEEKERALRQLQEAQLKGEAERTELNRQITVLSQASEAVKIGIVEKLSPVYRQLESARNRPMSVDLGEAMKIQLGRVFDGLKQFGIEI